MLLQYIDTKSGSSSFFCWGSTQHHVVHDMPGANKDDSVIRSTTTSSSTPTHLRRRRRKPENPLDRDTTEMDNFKLFVHQRIITCQRDSVRRVCDIDLKAHRYSRHHAASHIDTRVTQNQTSGIIREGTSIQLLYCCCWLLIPLCRHVIVTARPASNANGEYIYRQTFFSYFIIWTGLLYSIFTFRVIWPIKELPATLCHSVGLPFLQPVDFPYSRKSE